MRFDGACECGACEWFGSDPAPRCARCSTCGTGPRRREPEPHDFSATSTVETDDGPATLTRCRYCYRTRKQIERMA